MDLPHNILIEPSILSADFLRLGEQVDEAEKAGADGLQIDIMDGHFVPNLSFGPGIVRAIRARIGLPLDVHLMIANPDDFLQAFADAGANRIIVHQETCQHLFRTLQTIRQCGVEAGVALNPATPIIVLEEVLDLLDAVQIMTVNPGFGGQEFLPSQLGKIRRLRNWISERGLNIHIAVDGGIGTETAGLVVQAGADLLVAGSAIYNSEGSVAKNLADMRKAAVSIKPG